jgi:hypothetical protein
VIFRVPATDGEDAPPFESGHVYTLALPTLTGRHQIRVDTVRRERLALVTFAEVRRELGHYRSQAAWRAAWVQRHDAAWCRRHPTASEHDRALRFSQRWSSRDAWVVAFVLIEPPRLLQQQRNILVEVARRGTQAQTTGRMPQDGSEYVEGGPVMDWEAEAVDAWTQERISAPASARGVELRAAAKQAKRDRRKQRVMRLRRAD